MKFLSYRQYNFLSWLSLLIISCINPVWPEESGDRLLADFRYRPGWWQTSISAPDDWQKTLVGKDGSLLYDYPGQFDSFKTKIVAGVAGEIEWVSQALVSPYFPLVKTVKRSGPFEIAEEAFALAPPFIDRLTPVEGAAKIDRLGMNTTLTYWAKPPDGADPAFQHVDVGYESPLRYRFKAKPKAEYTVVFGLCEGFYEEGGIRILDFLVEGAIMQNADIVAEKGRNVPGSFAVPAVDSNEDGYIDLSVAPNEKSSDANAILNVLWVFYGKDIPPLDRIMTGEALPLAAAYRNCGFDIPDGSPRQDLLIVRYRNTGVRSATTVPTISIRTEIDAAPSESKMQMVFHLYNQLVFSEPIDTTMKAMSFPDENRQPDKTQHVFFKPAYLAPGESHELLMVVNRGQYPVTIPFDRDYLTFLHRRAEAYWKEYGLPYGHILVPDASIQSLLDSSIRNIYQAREIKDGLPAYQTGPTVSRSMSVADASFILEALTFLNKIDDARAGFDYLLAFQREDGAFLLVDGHWMETGIVLWAVARHAQLTGDREWLESVWPRIEKGFAFIQTLRGMPQEGTPNFRLIPDGFSGSGLAGRYPEYASVYWTRAGLKSVADAAHWLGKTEQAGAWQKEYADFYQTFSEAAKRDALVVDSGQPYLPIRMRDDEDVKPQKAQSAFLHAVFPGRIFESDDPVVLGNMAMLRATGKEETALGTGWLPGGIQNVFASYYGHAWLWLGDGRKAGECLYALANHASPLFYWREEQMPRGKGNEVYGDMPSTQVGAGFIRLIRHLLVLERGDELHLLQGFPEVWAQPSKVMRVTDVLTEFGLISFELTVSEDGETALLNVLPPKRNPPSRIVLHLESWTNREEVYDLNPTEYTSTTIQLKQK